ncbi:g7631 [Coccomyxa elongata]
MPLGRRGKDQKESQTLRNTLLKAACDDKGATAGEWKEAHGAAMLLGRRGADLEEQMARSPCMLVMEYIPGRGLFQLQEPFQPPQILRTAEDLGRLFLLDMLLGNADRLPCEALGWRGNPHNVLFCDSGVHAGRMVAIDSAVQRRPPGGKMWLEDAACNKLAELALNDVGVAGSILREAVSCSPFAVRSVDSPDVHKAFQQGLLTSLQATLHIKGLLEMMFDVLSGWIDEFISDMEDVETTTEVPGTPPGTRPTTPPSASPGPTVHITPPPIPSHITPGGTRWGASSPRTSISTTQKIRSIGREARVNELISERLDHWKAAMRERGEELRAAVEEWQAKRASCSGAPRLTTGFLDGTCPIVDAYELKVRLEHMLQRLRVLQDAAATARPTRLLRHLWVGGAVEANSLHLLRHLGVTHLLNATEDLLLPDPATAFQTLRCSMRDMEEEDIGRFFAAAAAFIEEARSSGGAALVHCHEGKSRSVTLVLAYFMQAMDWTLKQALDFVTAARPQVSPNAGFMARLIRLEESLHGTKTVKLKKTKPEPRVCPVCSEKVGISLQSLSVHIRTKHNDVAAEYELMLRTCDSPK